MSTTVTVGEINCATARAAARSLMATQGGVASLQQLEAAGFSRRRAMGRVRRGDWSRRFGCMVDPRLVEDVHRRDAWAVWLRLGSDSIVSGVPAAMLQGANGDWPSRLRLDKVIAYLPLTRSGRALGATVSRRKFDGTVVRVDGLPLADRVTALLDTIERAPRRASQQLLDLCLQREWLSADDLALRASTRRADGRCGRRCTAAITRAEHRARAGHLSEAEVRFADLLRIGGLHGWKPNLPVKIFTGGGGSRTYVIDFAWPEQRLACEIDGRAFHSDTVAFQRDRERQNHLIHAGWTVLRFTWDDIVHHAVPTTRSVRTMLERLAE